MKVVALQTWAKSSISMEEKQVADIPDDLAAYLIERGIVAESPEYYGGGSGGGGSVVHAVINENTLTLDKTWQEIFDGDYVFMTFYMGGNKALSPIIAVLHDETYDVECENGDSVVTFTADSASGYPTATIG